MTIAIDNLIDITGVVTVIHDDGSKTITPRNFRLEPPTADEKLDLEQWLTDCLFEHSEGIGWFFEVTSAPWETLVGTTVEWYDT